MATITITVAGTEASTFQPVSDVPLPSVSASVPQVGATVDPAGSDPDLGLKVTKVKLEVSALSTTGAATEGSFEVFKGGVSLFTVDFNASGGSQSETTAIVVTQTQSLGFSVKWKATGPGTYLPASETVTLSVTTEDWER